MAPLRSQVLRFLNLTTFPDQIIVVLMSCLDLLISLLVLCAGLTSAHTLGYFDYAPDDVIALILRHLSIWTLTTIEQHEQTAVQ